MIFWVVLVDVFLVGEGLLVCLLRIWSRIILFNLLGWMLLS